MPLWTGRFSKAIAKETNDFNSSIPFDCRLWKQDINGSVAHARMLGKCGIIEASEAESIIEGLKSISADIESGKLEFDMSAEDIHSFIEGELTKRLGDTGKRLHTGRSRNDQVAVDLRLYLRDEIAVISDKITDFIGVLTELAQKNTDTVLPGYTHLQRAQPITFDMHLGAYVEMFTRDLGRLADCKTRMNFSPLGAGALAGVTYPTDRSMTAAELGFDGVMSNTLDSVSDRDYCLELASALSIVMVHLSRLCEEIVLWSSFEFRFIELDDAYSTGSSIMPQKKNPDIAELCRGKSGRVFGDLTALLTVMKGLPLAYNKDMQEDKEAIFDAVDTVNGCLNAVTPMIATMKVLPNNMRAAASGGFINATDCADYLVKKGLPFRDAYKAVGELVALCVEQNVALEELKLDEFKAVCPLFSEDVYDEISLESCIKARK